MIDEAKGNIFNIASGDPVSIRTMIEKICELTHSGKPQYGEIPYRPGENMALYANISKANNILGWKPLISLEEGLTKSLNSVAADNAHA